MNYELSFAEEDLQHAYWQWRYAYEREGWDHRNESKIFLMALSKYQDILRDSGYEWKIRIIKDS